MVLAEEATATWCGYCPAVMGYLDEIYSAGTRNFQYVALVDDMNTYAAARNTELGTTGYPTVFFLMESIQILLGIKAVKHPMNNTSTQLEQELSQTLILN